MWLGNKSQVSRCSEVWAHQWYVISSLQLSASFKGNGNLQSSATLHTQWWTWCGAARLCQHTEARFTNALPTVAVCHSAESWSADWHNESIWDKTAGHYFSWIFFWTTELISVQPSVRLSHRESFIIFSAVSVWVCLHFTNTRLNF